MSAASYLRRERLSGAVCFLSPRPHSHHLYLETKNVYDGPSAAAPELSLKSYIPCRPPNHTLWLSHYQHMTYNSHIKNTFSAGLIDHRVQGVVPSEYSGSRSKSESLSPIFCTVYIPMRHVSIRGLPRPRNYPVIKLIQCSTYGVHGPSRNAASSLRTLNNACGNKVTTNCDRRPTFTCFTTLLQM